MQMKVKKIRGKTGKSLKHFGPNQSHFLSRTAWEVCIPSTHSERCEWGFSELSPLPPPPVHHPPPLGCALLRSPSTSSHPSLLRFHFNRWSFSSFHTPLWEKSGKGEQDREGWKGGQGIVLKCFDTNKHLVNFSTDTSAMDVNGTITPSIIFFLLLCVRHCFAYNKNETHHFYAWWHSSPIKLLFNNDHNKYYLHWTALVLVLFWSHLFSLCSPHSTYIFVNGENWRPTCVDITRLHVEDCQFKRTCPQYLTLITLAPERAS